MSVPPYTRQDLRDIEAHSKSPQEVAAEIDAEEAAEKAEQLNNTSTALTLLREEEYLDKNVRVFGTPEEPLFLARDVAEWIDYSKRSDGSYKLHSMLQSVDEDEKIKLIIDPAYNVGGVLQANTEYWFLTENGLYEVLMLSRKPKAKQFKAKVKEILKTIRKTGGYVKTGQEDLFLDTYMPFTDAS